MKGLFGHGRCHWICGRGYGLDQGALERYFGSIGLATPEGFSYIKVNIERASAEKPSQFECTPQGYSEVAWGAEAIDLPAAGSSPFEAASSTLRRTPRS